VDKKFPLGILSTQRKEIHMRFTIEERKELEQNPNVYCVTSNNVMYTIDFKEKAVTEYLMGKPARQIFEEAGFNLSMLSKYSDYASKMLSKWRKENNKNNIQYPKKKIKEKQSSYQKMQARLEYLEAENEFLKKLRALQEQCK